MLINILIISIYLRIDIISTVKRWRENRKSHFNFLFGGFDIENGVTISNIEELFFVGAKRRIWIFVFSSNIIYLSYSITIKN